MDPPNFAGMGLPDIEVMNPPDFVPTGPPSGAASILNGVILRPGIMPGLAGQPELTRGQEEGNGGELIPLSRTAAVGEVALCCPLRTFVCKQACVAPSVASRRQLLVRHCARDPLPSLLQCMQRRVGLDRKFAKLI